MMENFTYRVTIGDINGNNINIRVTDDLASAEKLASRMLGKKWGDDREITLATIYKWDDGAYRLLFEMEL